MLRYASVFGGEGTIKLEFGQCEKPMEEIAPVPLATLLRDPLFDEEAVLPVSAESLSLTEAYAEKVRAALTREDPAPRDLFDLDYAVQQGVPADRSARRSLRGSMGSRGCTSANAAA